MAVRVPAHTESVILFTYETPGLKTGSFVSIAALAAFAAYLAAVILHRRTRRKNDVKL